MYHCIFFLQHLEFVVVGFIIVLLSLWIIEAKPLCFCLFQWGSQGGNALNLPAGGAWREKLINL
ncbi:hypothetical protein Ahy_A07g031406 isoform B [Arachis hypogaea]|uniref:Uncharacterized protein n=1 Tax=Arachis hypogaea TaxID=3818 RepID=A0A445C3T8_ARAHY|nr:hypothetical protein Ahy_A07g031406 isoform B [Arachis hypogaea]